MLSPKPTAWKSIGRPEKSHRQNDLEHDSLVGVLGIFDSILVVRFLLQKALKCHSDLIEQLVSRYRKAQIVHSNCLLEMSYTKLYVCPKPLPSPRPAQPTGQKSSQGLFWASISVGKP